MLLLEALKHEAKPKPRTRTWWVLGGALIAMALGAGVPAVRAAALQDSALVEMLASGQRSKEIRPIGEGSDAYLTFNKDIERAAVGSAETLSITTPSKREIVLNGKKVGRTSITVWFAGGSSEQFMVSVARDISTLDMALRSVSPGIRAEIAGDRNVVVLTGSVPDLAASRQAESAALDYLSSGSGDAGTGKVINLIKVQAPAVTLEWRIQTELERMGGTNVLVRRVQQGAAPDDAVDVFVLEGSMPDLTEASNAPAVAKRLLAGDLGKREERIINRMLVGRASVSLEGSLESAIRDLGCPKVRVRRIVSSEFPGDGDIVVLEGSVPTQTHLVRAVTLASKVFQQQELTKRKREGIKEIVREVDPSGTTRTYENELELDGAADDIRVVADESGALRKSQGSDNGQDSGRGIGQMLSAANTGVGTGSNFARMLNNEIDSNIARAKALEMAEGRLISFLTVEDLPQVRVDIRLFEINRTALLSWNSAQSGAVTDFETGSTLRDPSFVQNPITGEFVPDPNLTPTDNTDVRDVVSFLSGGFVNRLQISGDHVQINSLLALLEREGIARSLSSPQLTVLSGELAFFSVGGTVPIESSFVTDVTGSSGVFNQTIEREFGISLSVRPLVEADGMITLDLVPQISQPDADLTREIRDATGRPPTTTAFQSRSMRTSSRLRDGSTLLIGGLMSRTRNDNSGQTPFLHEVPVVGDLFKDYSYDDKDRELIIVVNPVIVREAPAEAPLWAFPTSKELMSTVPTHASIQAERDRKAQAEREKKAQAEAAAKSEPKPEAKK